jgi:ABC-type branched-subunit amino acid transport system permease subunit
VRTPRRKLELFVLGCVFAALGGAAYAGAQQFVPETLVDPTAELALLIMLFIGGRRSIIGAGTISDETAIMHKLQHLDTNALGIAWN